MELGASTGLFEIISCFFFQGKRKNKGYIRQCIPNGLRN